MIPAEKDVELVNDTIYHELCLGTVSERSRAEFIRILKELARRGAQGAVLGCTEIGLLVRQSDVDMPIFDTAVIHAEKAALLSVGP
jgi:aspartate racemase